MTAGSIIVPAIIPLRPPIPGKSKLSIDTNVKIELSTGKIYVYYFIKIFMPCENEADLLQKYHNIQCIPNICYMNRIMIIKN